MYFSNTLKIFKNIIARSELNGLLSWVKSVQLYDQIMYIFNLSN